MEFSNESIISPSCSPFCDATQQWFNAAGILLSLKHSSAARQVALGAYLEPGCSYETLSAQARHRYLRERKMEYPAPADYYPMRDNFESPAANENPPNQSSMQLDAATDVDVKDEGKEDAVDEKNKSNKCRVCNRVYARPSTLRTHMRTHTGEKPYRCTTCNKCFSQDANLTAHVRIHSGEKPFKCQICNRRFAQSSSVTTHMRTHSGERPYHCRICSRGFADSSTLTKHVRVHTGEKPYQCKICRARFSQSGNLSRHMRVHKK